MIITPTPCSPLLETGPASRVSRGAAGSGFNLLRLLGSVVGVLRRWRQREWERAVLAALDERSLRDIGISRTEVWAEVSKPFWRE